MLWLSLAVVVTASTARRGLPFSPALWSFTFPVGTMVTGTSQMATHAGSLALGWAAGSLYLLFAGAWAHRAWHGALGHAITAAGSDRPALGKHTTVEL